VFVVNDEIIVQLFPGIGNEVLRDHPFSDRRGVYPYRFAEPGGTGAGNMRSAKFVLIFLLVRE
jgi:hypothetical protein